MEKDQYKLEEIQIESTDSIGGSMFKASSSMANDEHNLDEILELTDSIEERLEASLQKQMNAYDFTMSQVTAALRRGKEVYYDPNILSIGPYHRGKDKYQVMEELKWTQLHDFLMRNRHIGINTYLAELSKLETKARRCYMENIKLSSKEFLEMMLLDGCFILEYFLKRCLPQSSHPSAPISYNSTIRFQVGIDLLLLENQIPFFILQCLFDLYTGKKGNNFLISLVAKSFYVYFKIPGTDYECKYEAHYVNECLKSKEVYGHLLHLFHFFHTIKLPQPTEPNLNKSLFALIKCQSPKCLNPLKLVSLCWLPKCLNPSKLVSLCWLPKCLNPSKLVSRCFCSLLRKKSRSGERRWRSTVPCATKLVEAGITFKKKSLTNFLDITYKDGTLEIPCIYMSPPHRIVLMNLIAFEQSNYPKPKTVVSFYVAFMDSIIDTAKDVEILQESNIIESCLYSDEETADVFNRLCEHVGILYRHSYLRPVIDEINEYCETSWHKWRANLVRDYFSNPWAILSLVAAIILLILTFLQTIFAMYSFFKPPQ